MTFNHLNVPDHWRHEYSKYPGGLSMLESLSQWVHQVDQMIDAANATSEQIAAIQLYVDTEIPKIINQTLPANVNTVLTGWLQSGTLFSMLNDMLVARFGADITLLKSQMSKKVGNGVLATMNDLGQDIKTAMTGGSVAVVGVGSVQTQNIVDKNITAEKFAIDVTTEITANNLYSPDYTPGGYYDQSSGNWTLSTRHTSSNLISCERLDWFFTDTGSGQVTFHDRTGAYVSGADIVSPNAFQVPDNIYIKFVRKVIDLEYPNPYVCRGKYRNSYKFTEKVLQPLEKDTFDATPLKLMEKITQQNFINFEQLVINGYFDYSTGLFVNSLLVTSSNIIPCKPGYKFYRSNLDSSQVSYWDINGAYVSGTNVTDIISSVPNDSRITGMRVNMTIGDNVRKKTAWLTFSEIPIKTRYKLTSEFFEIETEQVKNDFVKPYNGERNPVMTPEMVTDRTATGVADPFIVNEKGVFYMFFEVLQATQEEIGLAISYDLKDWHYDGIVLPMSKGHRSAYPHVFKVDGVWYMTPDTGWNLNLYKATTFPRDWELVSTALLPDTGYYNDTNIFQMDNVWWLTTSYNGTGVRLYRNDSGDFKNTSWTLVSTLVSNDAYETNMRCAGNPSIYDDYILLPVQVQPLGGVYGQYTYLYKVNGFSSGEVVVSNLGKIVDKQNDGGWADGAMHHASHTNFMKKDIYAVDGWKAPNRYTIGLYQEA